MVHVFSTCRTIRHLLRQICHGLTLLFFMHGSFAFASKLIYPKICGEILVSGEASLLPKATLRFATRSGFKLTPQVKVSSFADLNYMKGDKGLGYYKKTKAGSHFYRTKDHGSMVITENDSDNKIELEVLKQSQVMEEAREILTLVALGKSDENSQQANVPSLLYVNGPIGDANGAIVEGGPEVDRFLAELSTQGDTWSRFYGLEAIHSHPWFELINSNGEIFNIPLSSEDFEIGIRMSTSVLSGALVIITAVVPNGYRYSAGFFNGQNVTEEIFE